MDDGWIYHGFCNSIAEFIARIPIKNSHDSWMTTVLGYASHSPRTWYNQYCDVQQAIANIIAGTDNRIATDTLHDAYLHTTRDLDSRLEAALAPFGQPSSNTTSTKVKDIVITIRRQEQLLCVSTPRGLGSFPSHACFAANLHRNLCRIINSIYLSKVSETRVEFYICKSTDIKLLSLIMTISVWQSQPDDLLDYCYQVRR